MFFNLAEYVEHVVVGFSDADDYGGDDFLTTFLEIHCDIGTVN